MKDVQGVSGHCVKIKEHQRLKKKKGKSSNLSLSQSLFFPVLKIVSQISSLLGKHYQ